MDKLTLEMLLNARRVQNAINLFLINAIPAKGFSAVPVHPKDEQLPRNRNT
jgi:hypothetical protein